MSIMNKTEIKKNLNAPNILSFIRLLCVPLFLTLFFVYQPNYIPAFVVFVVASVTDVIDGIIARKCNLITQLGIVLDPLADKLLKMSALFALGFNGIISWWLVAMLFVIDFAMIIAGVVLYRRKITIPSNAVGKTGTFVMSIGLIMSFFPEVFAPWHEYILYIGLGIVISSVILYIALNFKTVIAKMKEFGKQKKESKKHGEIASSQNEQTAVDDKATEDSQETENNTENDLDKEKSDKENEKQVA